MPFVAGAISIFVALICVGALILHLFVMKRRVALDTRFAALDNLLHARLELLYEAETVEAQEICDAAALETRKLLKFATRMKIENSDNDEIERAVAACNEAIAEYNAYIAKFPAKIMAFFLGLKQEKEI